MLRVHLPWGFRGLCVPQGPNLHRLGKLEDEAESVAIEETLHSPGSFSDCYWLLVIVLKDLVFVRFHKAKGVM